MKKQKKHKAKFQIKSKFEAKTLADMLIKEAKKK